MGWKATKWKLNIKSGKERWLVMLAVGLICLILALPTGDSSKGIEALVSAVGSAETGDGATGNVNMTGGGQELGGTVAGTGKDAVTSDASSQASAKVTMTYEQQLEERLEELLSHVDGVGKVEVMIVLKSSEEKVWRVDQDTSYSVTQETDSNGGNRKIESQDISQDTILSGQSGQEGPLLEKEINPEIGGVVVSAEGGGSPQIQAEISAAVEALFDVPSHKIKVLKRAE